MMPFHAISLPPAWKVRAGAPAAMLDQAGNLKLQLCTRLAESRNAEGF